MDESTDEAEFDSGATNEPMDVIVLDVSTVWRCSAAQVSTSR